MYKKLLLIILSALLLVVAVLLSAPYFLKDRITSSIENYIDDKFKYDVTFSSRLSFARHFPNLSLTLDDVVVMDGDGVVAQAEHVDIVMKLSSVIKNKELRYKEVVVGGGYFNYFFAESGVGLELFRVDLSLKGDMSADISPVKIDCNIGELFLVKDSVIFLDGAKLSSEIEAEIDTENKRTVIGDSYIDLNGLTLKADGELGYANAGIDMDISFSSEDEEMSTVLKALVPPAFLNLFEGSGLVSVDGSIVGKPANIQEPRTKLLLKLGLMDGGLSYIDEHGDILGFNGTGTLVLEPVDDSLVVKYVLDSLVVNGIEAFDVKGTSKISDHSVGVDINSLKVFDGSVSGDGLLKLEHGKGSTLQANMVFKDVDLAASIGGVPAIKKFVPSEGEVNGKIDLTVDFKSNLGEGLSIIPGTVEGKGRIESDSIYVKESIAFENMKKVLQLGDNYTSTFHGIDIMFNITGGRMYVEPFTTSVGNLKLNVSGDHGLDNTLNYLVKTDMPRADLGTPINSLINLFSGSMSALGLKVPIDESVKMNIKITGSSSKPVITPIF